MKPRERLDKVLVDRGIVENRTRARSLIMQGYFRVNGQTVTKPGTLVSPDAVIEWIRPEPTYISRGEIKLNHALDVFRIDVRDRTALDIGASTGGFTHCLLRRGACRVYAIDVGYGQLDWRLRQDPRVVVMERTNARYLTRSQIPEPIQIVTIDVSFISVTKILPAVTGLDLHGDVVVLVKPQFELSPRHVGRRGVVREPAFWAQAIRTVAQAARHQGCSWHGVTPSPIRGAEGNQEFFLHLHYPARLDGFTQEFLGRIIEAAVTQASSP